MGVTGGGGMRGGAAGGLPVLLVVALLAVLLPWCCCAGATHADGGSPAATTRDVTAVSAAEVTATPVTDTCRVDTEAAAVAATRSPDGPVVPRVAVAGRHVGAAGTATAAGTPPGAGAPAAAPPTGPPRALLCISRT